MVTFHYFQDRDFGDEEDPIICPFKTEEVFSPIGMFHCPECGEMQLAGLPHLLPEDYVTLGLAIAFTVPEINHD